MNLIAKQVIKDKFWVVEHDGQQVATIQTTPEGVTFVYKEQRENFVSIKLLSNKYNITIAKEHSKRRPEISHDVYGFPCDGKPHNLLLNIAKRLPVYSKTPKSKSYYCAGHYLIKINTEYIHAYCPKLITLNRYEFIGPFLTKSAAKTYLKDMKNKA